MYRSTTNDPLPPKPAPCAPADPQVAAHDIATAKQVLEAEAQALTVLAASLDGAFAAAVERIAQIRARHGRVVVTGMGKSGIVGRKIAATLASTGTPAFFVHPAEASHGDLGMITVHDAVLALSNSGETSELSDVTAYTHRWRIPLLAITSRGNSTLALRADHVLLLPPVGEACPLGLAPTTSTTMMLALGDALAVALLERHDFSPADFQTFHPGGKLGKSLLRVLDLMHGVDTLPLARPEQAMPDVLAIISRAGFGCAGVADAEGRLVGVITDGDLRRHMDERLIHKPASAVMSPTPKTIGPEKLAAEALALMDRHKIATLFVTDALGRPVGLLQTYDCLRAGLT
jgi:arabinose-5-phosphate isomerase